MIHLNIDMQTILLVIVLGHFLTGALIIAYTRKQNRSKAVNLFLLSKLLQPLGLIMLGMRGVIYDQILVIACNSILFFGAALELIALMILKNSYTSKVKRVYTALLISCIAVFSGVILCGFPENVRITFASFITVALMVFPVVKLFADINASRLQRVVAVLYGITIPLLIFRGITAVTTELEMTLASTSFYNTGMFLQFYIVMLAGSTGFILLDKEKQDIELLRAASYDGLTNTLNRNTFISRSKELISLCLRKQEKVSFLLIDIDDFKKINDQYGHYIGDVVLQDFADIVRKQLRNYDLFCRYGGDEFAIFLPGTGESAVVEVAERLRAKIENTSAVAEPKIKYTISIGFYSTLPNEATDVDMLFKLCDEALYQAKSHGKNCYRSAVEAEIKH